MAAFDFPSSPSVNQTYTANGVTWKWNGTMWMRVSGAGYLEKIEEGNSKIEVDDSGTGNVTVTTDGTERVRIDNVGWLGLNQTTKDNAGQVAAFKNTNNANSWLSVNVNNNTGIGGVVFGDSDSWAPAYIQYDHTNNYMQFISNAAERLRITADGDIIFGTNGAFYDYSTGRMGVGTVSPGSTRLHVKGHSSLNSSLLVDVNTGDSTLGFAENGTEKWRIENVTSDDALRFYDVPNTAERFRIRSDGRVTIGTQTINTNSMLSIHRGSSDESQIRFTNTTTGEGGNNGLLVGIDSNEHGRIFNQENTPLRFGTNNIERLRITSDGQLRIGNSTITASTSADDLIIGLDSPGGDRGVTIISGTSGTGNIFFSDTDTSGVGNRMGTITYDHSENFMRFSTAGNNERLRITSGGNLQVKGGNLHLDSNAELALFEDNTSGTYTNSAKIAFDFSGNVARMRSSTNGSASLRDLAFYIANTAALYIKTDGKIGISSTAPKTDLDVSTKTGAVALPQGTTAQRPTGSAPYIRKNTTNNALEYYDGTSWVEIITDYFPTGSVIFS